MAYQYNAGLEYDLQADFEHDWTCSSCFKTISPDRPPVLNLDNCSCSEAGMPVNDPSSAARAHVLSMTMDNLHLTDHAPPSYPSSTDGSVKAPDGPEGRDPANKYLQLAPATGLGEMQHRRRASFDEVEDQLSYSLRNYLKTLPPHERSFHASWDGVQGGWLRQDTHLVGPTDSVRATRGKSSGSASVLVSSGHSGASSGWKSFTIDPVAGSGAWMGESLDGGWPMEIDEDAIEEDSD